MKISEDQTAMMELNSTTYVEDYIDACEYLSSDIQRELSKMSELDTQFQGHMRRIEIDMEIMLKLQEAENCETEKWREEMSEVSSRIEMLLLLTQRIGYEKMHISEKIQELLTNKVAQLDLDKKNLDVSEKLDNQSQTMERTENITGTPEMTSTAVSSSPVAGPSSAASKSNEAGTSGIGTMNETKRKSVIITTPIKRKKLRTTVLANKKMKMVYTKSISNSNPLKIRFRRVCGKNSKPRASAADNTEKKINPEVNLRHGRVRVGRKPKTSTLATAMYNPSNGSGDNVNASMEMAISSKSNDSFTKKNVIKNKRMKKVEKTKTQEPVIKPEKRKYVRKCKPTPSIPLKPDQDEAEPTYCFCNDVSYGMMIACDNTNCSFEWFHFDCVSLTDQPEGMWYCPHCRGDTQNQMSTNAIFLKGLEKHNHIKLKQVNLNKINGEGDHGKEEDNTKI